MLHLRKREDSGHRFLLEAPSSKLSQLRRKIRDLGGFYIDSKYFDKSATHLVTDSIKCSEKFLGACVRGLWVLSPKYIEDSSEVGLWLDEESYEYSLSDLGQPSDLIAAARRWRWKVSTYQEHPFTGMQVALAMESNSIFYEKLLLYGGAQISKLQFPLHNDIHLPEIAFVFMDQSYKKHVARLTEHGLLCLHYMYITDTIIKDEELDILNYAIREGTNISDSLDRKRYHFTGQKQTCILDISHSDQTKIQEITVDCNLSAMIFTMDNESGSSYVKRSQEDIGTTSDSIGLSANKSRDKSVSNHSKSKTKCEPITPLRNSVHLNKETVFEAEGNHELIFRGEAAAKIMEQPQACTNQPDLSDSKNNSSVLSTPGHKHKLYEARDYETKELAAKKCLSNKPQCNIMPYTPVCTSPVSETGLELSDVSPTGNSNKEHKGACHQNSIARKLVFRAKRNNIKHKRTRVSQPKSLPLVQMNGHMCDLDEHSGDLHRPTTTDRDSVKKAAFVEPHKTASTHLLGEFLCKNADVDSNNCNSTNNGLDFEICPTVHADSKMLKSATEHESSPGRQAFRNKDRNLWSDSIANICTESQFQHNKQEKDQNIPSVSLSPNIYLYGLEPSTPDPASNAKLSPLLKTSLCETKEVKPSTISKLSKCFQARLERFGFSPLPKDKNNKESSVLSLKQDSPSGNGLRSSRKQIELNKPKTQTADSQCTKRGLAKRKNLLTSTLHTDLTVKSEEDHQISAAGNEALHTLIVVSDEDSDTDIITDDSHIEMTGSPAKSLCTVAPFHDTIAEDATVDVSKSARTSSGENAANSSLSKAEKQEMETVSMTGASWSETASMTGASWSETVSMTGASWSETAASEILSPHAAPVAHKEQSKPDRSLFATLINDYNHLNARTTSSIQKETVLDDTRNTDRPSCLQSSLFAGINVLSSLEDNKSADIKINEVLKIDDKSDLLPISACSPVEDYIDLPTPPSIAVSQESDSEDIEEISCEDNTNTTNLAAEVLKQLPSGSKIEHCDKNMIRPIEMIETGSCSWHLTYPSYSDADSYRDMPSLPSIYWKWMESAREMGFHDYAITHARPASSRAPTSLLLAELVKLVWVEEVGPQAVTYLYTWLGLHPPVASVTVSIYMEAFELTSPNSVVLEVMKSVSEESKHKFAVLLLEYFVSLFEINFRFCLKSRNTNLIKNCMIVKWIWGHSHAVVSGGISRYLLRLFGDIISSTMLDYRACKAACALLSMACECIRLAGVQWVQDNPQFIMDSVITFSYDLVKKVNTFCTPDTAKSKMVVLGMFKPAWLRTLLTGILLSHYNQYLLPDRIHVNKISLSIIVSQFFFLVPELEPRGGPDSKGKENLQQNNTTKPVKETQDLMKVPKGTLTSSKVNRRNGKGESAIHIACMKNKALDLERLLAVPGVDVNLRDNYGWTPLHEACNRGSLACAELLLKYVPTAPIYASEQEQKLCKVEIDAVGPEGLTPLHDAIRSNKIDVCKLLLSYGGHKLLKSKLHNGMAAMDLAQSAEMKDVLNSFCESASHLNQSISQESQDSEINIDAANEIAPQAQRYIELTETGCGYVVSRASCEEYLVLLMGLVASYYSVLGSVERRAQSDVCLDPRDKDVLADMSTYVKLLKRHVRKLTRPEDFQYLQSQLELFEILCESGPEKYG